MIQQLKKTSSRPVVATPPPVRKPWVTADRWPDARTLEAFGRDCIRLENAQTGEETALAIYTWLGRCFGITGASAEGPKGAEGFNHDTWKDFNVYGQGLCDRWGRLMADVANAVGIRSRKIATKWYPSGEHSTCELWYRDFDGVERWHWFDPKNRSYVRTPDGARITGMQEWFENPTLFVEPSHVPKPFNLYNDGHKEDHYKHWDRELMNQGVKNMEAFFVESYLWPSVHSMDKDLLPGETYSRYWKQIKDQFYKPANLPYDNRCCPNGWHDAKVKRFINGSGRPKEPHHYRYWKNYLTTCDCSPGIEIRPHGNGLVTFEPDLASKDLGLGTWRPLFNASHGDGREAPRLHPEKTRCQCVALWELTSPYIITDTVLEATVRAAPGDSRAILAFYLSTNDGSSWSPVWDSSESRNRNNAMFQKEKGLFQLRINLGKERWNENLLSTHGLYRFLFRVEMWCFDNPANVGLDHLKITNTVQLNMFSLPMLQPGSNTITAKAEEIQPGWGLETLYRWTDRSGAQSHRHVSKRDGEQHTIVTDAESPEEIAMKEVTLRAVRLEE